MPPLSRCHRGRPVQLAQQAEPPVEFRLFPLGKVETTKGTFFLTEDDARACVERHRRYGNDLSIDWGHGVFEEAEGTPQRAAGWIAGLEARPDGLWATGVTWTSTAARMIRAREQRYFSPAFHVDEEGHIREILNVALTLMPATHHLTPLVASRRSGRTLTPARTPMEEKYIDATALRKLADEIDKMAEGEGEEQAKLRALAERCRKLADDGETLAKLAEEGDGEDKETASDDEERDKETASDDEDKEEAKAASRIVAAAREATGHKKAAAVVGALKALAESKGAVAKLSARVAELEAAGKAAQQQAKKERVASLVRASATPGPACKITPAEVDALIGWGMKDEEGLRAYLDAKPALLAASRTHEPAAHPNKAAYLASLSSEELKVIRTSGFTPDEFYERLIKLPA